MSAPAVAKGAKIVVLGTGGTIAGTAASAQDTVGYVAAQIGVGALLESAAVVEGGLFEVEQVTQLDSKDMSHEGWRALALRAGFWLSQPEVAGLVVTHGTDTLEETAWFLQRVLQPSKPVVFTCAMRPATALLADGPQNLRDAVTVARHCGACGVVVVCSGVIHAARDVCKAHTYKLDAFSSGDAGPLGFVEGAQVRMQRAWPARGCVSDALLAEDVQRWPRVEMVVSHAGASGRVVDLLVADGVDGLVVAATGNGTMHSAVEAALDRAQQRGVHVVRATRCAQGRIVAAPHAVPAHADDLSPVKARVSLLLDLASRQDEVSPVGSGHSAEPER